MVWVIVTILLSAVYLALILFYLYHWLRIESPVPGERAEVCPFVSIVIVGRNEAENIPSCLGSIFRNNYPEKSFELIYVDDHSSDQSLTILRNFPFQNLMLLSLENYRSDTAPKHFKKRGIAYALSRASGELILHCDADILVGPDWISAHVDAYRQGKWFTTAPVCIVDGKGFLHQFQRFDLLSTMGVTGAGIQAGWHFLANGANMSYSMEKRKAIRNVHGMQYASGDDVFLAQTIGLQDPEKMSFLSQPEAVVLTKAEPGWASFFNQRFRWAGKSMGYKDFKLLAVEILVFAFNLWLLMLLFMTFYQLTWLKTLIIAASVKILIDAVFIQTVARKLKIKPNWLYYFPSFCFYPFYYLVIGLSAIFPLRSEWKGRKITR
jgi:glycosyltransferase involved in cell wall biosynthesis